MSRFVYPFSAIVGQEKLQKGLIFNAINPKINGILIRGEKGTAKSTAVRALAALLPVIEMAEGCRFNCNPQDAASLCADCRERIAAGQVLTTRKRPVQVIDLPVSATEDRVVGSLDFEYAIKYGKPRFEPGILAKANRGIVYIDEVNLLDDHIVDVLLDAAAMGTNIVEREGISYAHPAEFMLVGTMNPEEGELRPQFLDRFGLCVQVQGVKDPQIRVEIIKRREEYDADPLGFIAKWEKEEQNLAKRIAAARKIVAQIQISNELINLAADLCVKENVAGHRADITLVTTARTIAAWHGRTEVLADDIQEAAELVLFHRFREAPPPSREQQETQQEEPEEQDTNEQDPADNDRTEEDPRQEDAEPQEPKETEETLEQEKPEPQTDPEDGEEQEAEEDPEEHSEEEQPMSPPSAPLEKVFAIGNPFTVKKIANERDPILRKGSGRRSRTKTASRAGRYIRSTLQRRNNDLAFDATMRSAAPHQIYRRREGVAIAIETADIREKIREKRIGNLLLFLVDASGSMGAQQRMVETKGAILSLLLDAYQKRDKIGLIAFKGNTAEVLLPPTNSVEMGQKLLEELPTGGKTPLSAGLYKAYEVAKTNLFKEPNISPLLIIISDGKGNVSMGEDKALVEVQKMAQIIQEAERIKTLVIDVEKEGLITFGLAQKLAQTLGGDYFKIDDLKADTLVQAVKQA
ncbi:putative cobaltochelatase [Dehalobacter sp. DCM]|uniref:putative cobaltochelatase n=1 Tax=Dehalobacter sp. DCM TaxID=2907827 RepID=UPI00308189BA|nr:putative cobaltochelatase [Dehalobacter sp. DCM]